MERVLVIGCGAAGMAAALELSRRGIASTIVESSDRLGGLSSDLCCKGAPNCIKCDACSPGDVRRELLRSPLVQVHTRTRAVDALGKNGKFTVTVCRSALGSCSPVFEELEGSAVILAIGPQVFDARADPRLHYGEIKDVLTSLDVERMLSQDGGLRVPSTGARPKSMAIVQCVGSRDSHRGASYC